MGAWFVFFFLLISAAFGALLTPSRTSLQLQGEVLRLALNRGKGSGKDVRLESLVSQMERSWVNEQQQADATPVSFANDLWQLLSGDWELRYTTNSRSDPVRRVGPLVEIERVVQRIGPDASVDVENILRVNFAGQRASIKLLHDVKVISDAFPAQLAIDLRSVVIEPEVRGSAAAPLPLPLPLPLTPPGLERLLGLKGAGALRRGFFDTTYVSQELRVSRGLFGELRLFTRAAA
jgi:hypothetical protein